MRKIRNQKSHVSYLYGGLAVAFLILGGIIYSVSTKPAIDPLVYRPLLDTIASGESNGNYNAYFGNASNDTIRFTDMTIAEVQAWQLAYIQSGSKSSAVGRYQIISSTLNGLVRQLDLDTSQRFDTALQDRLAVALLERRGADDYMRDAISRDQFAANLSREWAALPRVIGSNPDESYYAGDGLNKSRVSVSDITKILESIKPQ